MLAGTLILASLLASAPPAASVGLGSTAREWPRLGLGAEMPASMRAILGKDLVARAGRPVLVHRDETFFGPAWHFESEETGASLTAVIVEGQASVVARLGEDTFHAWVGRGGSIERAALPDPLPCGGAIEFPSSPARTGGVAGACDGPERIDLLVLWSPEAESEADGSGGINALIAAAEASANAAYAASGILTRIEIIYAARLDLVQSPSGMAADLYAISDPNDGIVDQIHPLRDALAADMVALIGKTDASYCGIAWLMTSNGPESAGSMFSVTAWSCLGGQVLAHELGHNMGCCHAPGDGGGCTSGGIYPYSVGHRFVGNSGQQYRTIMAYSPGIRIDRFASPDVLFNGVATGVPVPADGSAGRHNARTINETMATIAAFRCSATATGLGDCDGNLAPDAFDLANLRASDLDGNGTIDRCQLDGTAACPGPLAVPASSPPLRLSLPVGAAAGDRWGSAVATDGLRWAVGAEGKAFAGLAFAGEVRVVRLRADGPFTEATLRLPGPQAFDLFGASVAIAGDLLAVGAPGRDPAGVNAAGEVHLFRRIGGAWTPWRVVTAPVPADAERFGDAVAIDGETLAIGAGGTDVGGAQDAGSVYLYRIAPGGVEWLAQLRHPTPGSGDNLGRTLDLDGDALIAGAGFRSASGLWTGGVVFARRSPAGWAVETTFEGDPDTGSPNLGRAVAISGDRAFAGAPNAGNGQAWGEVRIFRREGDGWIPDGTVLPPGLPPGERFGSGLACDGDTLLVGSRPTDPTRSQTRVFSLAGGPVATGERIFGSRPAIADHLQVVGAPSADLAGASSGAAIALRRHADCDGNGVDDLCDIAAGAPDLDGNSVPDACDPPAGPDLDGDGSVSGADLAILLGAWGDCGGCPADLDGDGLVGAADLAMLLAAWTAG
jgi:hypothetical protein